MSEAMQEKDAADYDLERFVVTNKLILFGDSWTKGVWATQDNEITCIHPGMSEYLNNAGYTVSNMGRAGASLWQILYGVFTYLNFNQSYIAHEDVKIIVFQTDAARRQGADAFQVDYNLILRKSVDTQDFYKRILEIFYIKLNEIAEQFNVKIYVSGGITDLNLQLFTMNNFSSLHVLCESWIKLLYPEHTQSIIPLLINPDEVKYMLSLQHTKIVDELITISDKNFPVFTSILETECFGREFGHFHPNLLGHNIIGKHIKEFFDKENNA